MSDDDSLLLADEAEGLGNEPSAPLWMATYIDLATLLLAFFVLVVAMSATGPPPAPVVRTLADADTLSLSDARGASADLREQASRAEALQRYVRAQGLDATVDVDLTAAGIRITVADAIAFASGSADLGGTAEDVLRQVGRAARGAGAVEVEGHTDDRPVATAAYASNWELSAARAAAVVRFLLDQPGALPPGRYLAVGYGEFHPRAPNATPAARARNRRIAILLRPLPSTPDVRQEEGPRR